MADITASTGFKRFLGSILALVIVGVSHVPALAPLVPYLQYLAAAWGGVAVGHALYAGTIGITWSGTLTNILQSAILLAQAIPSAAAAVPILQAIVSILASFHIGSKVG